MASRVATANGVHWTYLGGVERGQRSVRVENLLKLAAGLRTTPGALLDGLDPPAETER